MPKRISDFLGGVKMTVVSGIFLAISLSLLIVRNVCGLSWSVWLDPAWVSIVISGYPLVYLAISRLIRQRWVSSALLISVAMVASVAIGEVFAAGEVAFIMAVGSILEDKTTERAKKGLRDLISCRPATGRVLCSGDGQETERIVPASEIREGMRLRVLSGETVPADGTVLCGVLTVDQSVLTGESLPVDKFEGDEVSCGSLAASGAADILVTGAGENTSLDKMIRLLDEAEEKKAPIARTADKWATILVPAALLIAVITGLVVYFVTGDPDDALNRAVTILVVFCPCALALATPTAVMASIGQATKYGVLIKSGEAAETVGKCRVIAFDKTGTLTKGELTVSDVLSFGEMSEDDILALAAALETRSEHPLGKAVRACAKEKNLPLPETENFRQEPGFGIRADAGGDPCFCGNRRYMETLLDESSRSMLDAGERFAADGKAVLFLARNRELLGALTLSDTVKENAADTIRKLRKLNLKPVLLTGDNAGAAAYLAERTGIDDVRAGLLPHGKAEAVLDMQKDGTKVCMVGDGINDAAALKCADAGVAMHDLGSDLANEAASVSVLGDDLGKLPYLILLSRATVNTIRFSIALSMSINFVAIVLSAFGILTPVTGAIVHNAGSCFVVLIAALLYERKIWKKASKL